MCDPVTATGLALSAGGTFLQTREANKNAQRVQTAKDNAYEEGMIRQRKYADETGQAFSEMSTNQGREAFDTQRDAEADRVKQAFSDIRTQPDHNQAFTSSTPKNVVLARQRASDTAGAETDRDVDALSRLSGYGGALFNQGMDRNKFTRLFGNVQDEASRDSRLIGMDMSAAGNNASKSPSLFPQLLKAGGQAMGMYASAGGTATAPNQAFGLDDLARKGAIKDAGYSLKGGYGPYRY